MGLGICSDILTALGQPFSHLRRPFAALFKAFEERAPKVKFKGA
jgi:hypothetical protein